MRPTSHHLILTIHGTLPAFAVSHILAFYPSNSRALRAPEGIRNKLIARRYDGNDLTMIVQACDWPHTFLRPFNIGEAYWPEKYAGIDFHWSGDGSLVVLRSRLRDEDDARFEAAYDFRGHKGVNRHTLRKDRLECDRYINGLLQDRGGLGLRIADIPSEKEY